MVGGNFGVLLDVLRLVSVMCHRMMRLGDADVRVTPAAAFVTDHKGKDTRDVALEGEPHQLVGDGHVFVEGIGYSSRRIGAFRNGAGSGFHPCELLFDVADIGQIFVEYRVVGRAQLALHFRSLLDDRIQNALLLLEVVEPLLRRAGFPKHAFERHAGIDAHGQRAGVIAPGDGVEEDAGKSVAGAGGGAHIFGADLQRTQRRIFRHLVGDVLIDGLLGLNHGVVRLLGDRAGAVQPCRACAHVDAAHIRIAIRRFHLADGDEVAAIRLQRLHDRLEFEVAAGLLRMP